MTRGLAALALVAAIAAGCSGLDAPPPPRPTPDAPSLERTDPDRPPPREETPVTQLTAAELQARAVEALGVEATRTRLTPPLPAAWPDAGGRVVFLAYRREALPSGRVRFLVRPPRHAVEVDVGSGEARLIELSDGAALGEAPGGRADVGDLEAAAQALVDVVAGRRPAAGARPDLAAYRRWLEAEPLVADDLRTRPAQRAFLEWLAGRS